MNLLIWGVNIAVGGVIGYVTNWLAIKMLFRPYNAVTVFGKRLPFTPGVIPKERFRLSESVGEVITKDILTPNDFRAYFASDKFKVEISSFLESSIQSLLDTPISKIREAGTSGTASALFVFFKDALLELLDAPGIVQSMQHAFESGKEELLSHPLTDFVHKSALDRLLADFEDIQKRKAAITRVLGYFPGSSTGDSSPRFRQYLDTKLLKIAVKKLFLEFAPAVQKDFIAYCRQPEIHKQLETLAIKIIKGYIQKLNSIQRLIINIGGFDNALYDSIPGTVDEAIDAIGGILVNDDIHARIAEALVTRYANPTLPSSTASDAPKSSGSPIIVDIVDAFLASIEMRKLSDAWYDYCSRYSLADLLHHETGSASEGHFVQSLLDSIKDKDNKGLSVLYKAFTVSLHSFLDSLASKNNDATVRSFLQPSETQIQNVSSHSAQLVVSILTDQVPVVLKLLDIKSLVKGKLDSLDMAMIENLIIKVMNRELKAITLLGGVLGALIGLFQAVFMQFFR